MFKLLLVTVVVASAFVVEISADCCGGDPNAESGCSLNCNKHCSNYLNNRKGICPRIACPPNGCECKDGYYFDNTIKKCVLGKDCDPSNKDD